MTISEYIGSRIRAQRTEQGITQGNLAALVGMARPSIGMIENGKQMIAVEKVYLFANALYCELSDLMPSWRCVNFQKGELYWANLILGLLLQGEEIVYEKYSRISVIQKMIADGLLIKRLSDVGNYIIDFVPKLFSEFRGKLYLIPLSVDKMEDDFISFSARPTVRPMETCSFRKMYGYDILIEQDGCVIIESESHVLVDNGDLLL